MAPTIAESCGLKGSPDWIGTNLWRHRLPPERGLYFTEDLDSNQLYGIRRGHRKLIVRLYPTFRRTLFSLDQDPREQAGVDLPCAAEGRGDRQFLAALGAWRQRDVAHFPSLRFGEGSTGGQCEACIDIPTVREPFLTTTSRSLGGLARLRLGLGEERTRPTVARRTKESRIVIGFAGGGRHVQSSAARKPL